tara:strand:+ start:17 stop:379 length:363 start_codon:yes stop_codon:yes gene_type:complete
MRYSTRLVFFLKNVVIKIPVSRRGYLQGVNEKTIWDKYNRGAPLAELKWMWMGVVCQKKYNIVTSIPKTQVQSIKKIIQEFDFNDCDIYNPENWGIDGKRYILLDYGITKYISTLYKQNK